MTRDQAKQKIEQLMGRRDVIKAEISSTQLNMMAEKRDVQTDLQRLQQRLRFIDQELARLKKFW
ncbi:MAG: hypothetical protein HYV33_04290 [Candidatus Kerfeldbacteria bacterium]|nr:hypothetical protein [Candidatus Kerfeldbacteria bacterium]